MKKYYCLFAGDIYAIEFFGVNNIKELKHKAREFLGVRRLPNGTECWISNY